MSSDGMPIVFFQWGLELPNFHPLGIQGERITQRSSDWTTVRTPRYGQEWGRALVAAQSAILKPNVKPRGFLEMDADALQAFRAEGSSLQFW